MLSVAYFLCSVLKISSVEVEREKVDEDCKVLIRARRQLALGMFFTCCDISQNDLGVHML